MRNRKFIHLRRFVSTLAVLCYAAVFAAPAATTISWTLDADRNWNDPANWNPEEVPNGPPAAGRT